MLNRPGKRVEHIGSVILAGCIVVAMLGVGPRELAYGGMGIGLVVALVGRFALPR